ncbi:MAG: hypothetical protein RLW62_03055, partial [Gammaproteobacteria bacterium]
ETVPGLFSLQAKINLVPFPKINLVPFPVSATVSGAEALRFSAAKKSPPARCADGPVSGEPLRALRARRAA